MIPQFPSFKKLTPDDREEIETITHEHDPYSDFNFSSMWAYNTEEDFEISRINNNIIIRFQDYITNKRFYSFIGTDHVFETIHTLLMKAHADDQVMKHLKLIPESTINSLQDAHQFHIEEDRDNFDYVLDIEKMFAENSGTYSHKKRLARRFDRENPHTSLQLLNLENKDIHDQIIKCFRLWETERQKTSEETAQELTALRRTLITSDSHPVRGLGIFNSDEIVGFTLFETVHKNYGVIHYCKFDPSYKGIVEKLVFGTAQILKDEGCKYLNIEQDLGISGLRNSKNLWYPSHFLKKYTISF